MKTKSIYVRLHFGNGFLIVVHVRLFVRSHALLAIPFKSKKMITAFVVKPKKKKQLKEIKTIYKKVLQTQHEVVIRLIKNILNLKLIFFHKQNTKTRYIKNKCGIY